MNSTRLNPLAENYLDRLEAAAGVLPTQDRQDLVMELRSHLEAGLAEDASDAAVLNLLADLGSPEEIVAAAAQDSDMGSPRELATRSLDAASPWGLIEVLAVLGLTLGTFLVPIIGPLIGLGFAWASPRWTRREKAVATGLACLPLIAVSLGATVAVSRGPSTPVPVAPFQHLSGVLS